MLSMDFYNDRPRSATWEKVTKKIVDPITFSCTANVTFVPRIEDCSYETTCFAISHPRFGEKPAEPPVKKPSSKSKRSISKKTSSKDTTWAPMDFSTGTPIEKLKLNPSKVTPASAAGVPSLFASGMAASTPKSGNTKSVLKKSRDSPGNKPASLGAFFQKTTIDQFSDDVADDNMSIGSKSMNSRSVTDRSHAERSKSEAKLSKKSKGRNCSSSSVDSISKDSKHSRRSQNRRDSKESITMYSIDEQSIADFSVEGGSKEEKQSKKPTGNLSDFLKDKAIDEDDDNDGAGEDVRSVMSGSTMGTKSVSDRSSMERSKNEKKLKDKKGDKKDGGSLSSFLGPPDKEPEKDDEEKSLNLEDIGPVEKKLRFKEGHDQTEIPALTDSMYDDLFYASEELADFRYEAFLEEAGLDVDEYMNM